ncbi:hypothetical protein ZIOFF_047563 [Zingiber officinale]|uniref:Protein kinase domain-containing protein n=1 Tax=Zingiber officinale TaxID=94328 RepID=A0A8J5FN71_ZINOF|nr:hypothetical protein ZIOFF_047563 [Zingiber officinale]
MEDLQLVQSQSGGSVKEEERERKKGSAYSLLRKMELESRYASSSSFASSSKVVILACDATREHNEVEMRLTVNAIRMRGDILCGRNTLIVLGVLHMVTNPMGYQTKACTDSFGGTSSRALEEEVWRKLDKYESMLQESVEKCKNEAILTQIAETLENIHTDLRKLLANKSPAPLPEDLIEKLQNLSLRQIEKPKEKLGKLLVFKDPYQILKSEEPILVINSNQLDRPFIQEESFNQLQKSQMQFIHIDILQVRIQTLHRQEEGVMTLIVFRDNRWLGDQSILATMETDFTRGSQMVYVIPDMMMTIGDFFRNIQITILTRGYDQWRNSEANLLITRATKPETKSSGVVGFDLSADADCIIELRGRALISTGLSLEIPWGTYGRIATRSSATWKLGLDVGAGVIDSDYRGPALENPIDEDDDLSYIQYLAELSSQPITSTIWDEYPDDDEWLNPFAEGGGDKTQLLAVSINIKITAGTPAKIVVLQEVLNNKPAWLILDRVDKHLVLFTMFGSHLASAMIRLVMKGDLSLDVELASHKFEDFESLYPFTLLNNDIHVERHLRRDMKFYMKHITCKVASVSDNLFVAVPKPFVTNASSKETVEQKLFSVSRSVQPSSNMEEDDKNIGEANVRSLVSFSDYYSSITSQDYSNTFKLSMLSSSKSRFEDSSIMAFDGVATSAPAIKFILALLLPLFWVWVDATGFICAQLNMEFYKQPSTYLSELYMFSEEEIITSLGVCFKEQRNLSGKQVLEGNNDLVLQYDSSEKPILCAACGLRSILYIKESMKFQFSEIQDATNDFSKDNLLGEGGFGFVYKGQLKDDQFIAAKVRKDQSTQGYNEFFSEVHVLSFARHRNIVMLLGYCCKEKHNILVYEYICNKSLHWHLFNESAELLEWDRRHAIALGIAKGLRFLHEECRGGPIIHRDLRPSNVLLTHDFVPMTGNYMRQLVRYLAPEYAEFGIVSVRTDVYSFGVLLFQLISGRPVIDEDSGHSQHILQWAEPLVENLALHDLIDPVLGESYDTYELYRVARAAFLCVRRNPEMRPSVGEVVHLLEEGHVRDLAQQFVPYYTK